MNLPLFIGLRYTGARRRHQLVSFLSAVSITGLVVGVGLLIAVLSVMNGFDRELREKILALVPQAAIYHRAGIDDWRSLQRQVESHAGVIATAPFIELHALVATQGEAAPVLLYGIEPSEEGRVSRITDFLSAEQLTALAGDGEQGIVLGAGITERLGLQAGDRLMLIVPDVMRQGAVPKMQYFTLLKVLHTKTELDNTLAITSLDNAAQLAADTDTVSGLRLKLADLFEARNVAWNIVTSLGAGYYSSNWTNTHGNLYQAIHMSKNLVGLLMSLIVAIAALNVISTLVMVVVEKNGDIAILRTLGMSSGKIMRVFIVQGVVIGIIGTLLGVLFGIGLALVVEDAVQWLEQIFNFQFLKSDVYPLTYLPTELRWHDILQVALTAMAMSFAATIYPAWRASRVRPAEALRYE